MITLSSEDIYRHLSMKEVIVAIEEYYMQKEEQNEYVPERLFLQDGDNTALLMPSFYGNYYGAKLIGIAPHNSKINEPTLRGVYLLNHRKTMKPLALFDARTITAMRTGAVGGISIKYLAKKGAKTVGIIGCGDQGYSHLQAALAVRPIEKVFVVNRSKERLTQFINKVKKENKDLEIQASTIEELVSEGDIIIAATTSVEPVIPNDLIIDYRNKHIVGCGSFKPFMQELPDIVLKQANRIFVDSLAAFHESGDMIKAKEYGWKEEKVPTLKELCRLKETAYQENELTIFKSVGHSIFDIVTAKYLYEKIS